MAKQSTMLVVLIIVVIPVPINNVAMCIYHILRDLQ